MQSLRVAAFRLAIIVSLLIIYRCLPHANLNAGVPLSRAVYSDDGQLLRLQLALDGRYRLWLPLAEISPDLIQATILKEDRWFYYHPGVNPYRLVLAAISSYSGGARQGGSTLTMQLARLKYGINSKSPWGKCKQVLLALHLELAYSKQDILTAYLNLAPYGRNIEGVGAASWLYFDKAAGTLGMPEAFTLAVLPQKPNSRARGDSVQMRAALKTARDQLFSLWCQAHPDAQRLQAVFALELPLSARGVQGAPFLAPHFSRLVLQQSTQAQVHSTLRLPLQRLLEAQLQSHLQSAADKGIRNAAMLLLHVPTMSVQAYVGSGDFSDVRIFGQVDGMQARRSPGSTLKPLIYGLAMDQGLIHPKTILRDVPVAFGPFAPENFDQKFAGPMDATQALIRSRNTPAVSLAARLHPDLYDALEKAKVQKLSSREHYGLALALGGGELTGAELAGIYAAIASDGQMRTLRYQADAKATVGARVLSPEAAFLVRDMLRANPRPRQVRRAEQIPVAWKTGTSWGFRDAWSAGIAGEYVLVVWVGNFDGASNPALVGRNAAAPLFFRVIDALSSNGWIGASTDAAQNASMPYANLNLTRVPICNASGMLPNRWCDARSEGWFIPGVSPIALSNLHQQVVLDGRTGLLDCSATIALLQNPALPVISPRRTRIIERWPAALQDAYALAGFPRRKWPLCQAPMDAVRAPEISAPLRDVSYTLRAAEIGQKQIALRANGTGALYWFVGNSYIGSGRTAGFTPTHAGRFTVRVSDEFGATSSRTVQIDVRM
jgi:penicillin-binding protein 1C